MKTREVKHHYTRQIRPVQEGNIQVQFKPRERQVTTTKITVKSSMEEGNDSFICIYNRGMGWGGGEGHRNHEGGEAGVKEWRPGVCVCTYVCVGGGGGD